jgi:hypothetical protein
MRPVILKEISTDNTNVSLCGRLVFSVGVSSERPARHPKILYFVAQAIDVLARDTKIVPCLSEESDLTKILKK